MSAWRNVKTPGRSTPDMLTKAQACHAGSNPAALTNQPAMANPRPARVARTATGYSLNALSGVRNADRYPSVKRTGSPVRFGAINLTVPSAGRNCLRPNAQCSHWSESGQRSARGTRRSREAQVQQTGKPSLNLAAGNSIGLCCGAATTKQGNGFALPDGQRRDLLGSFSYPDSV